MRKSRYPFIELSVTSLADCSRQARGRFHKVFDGTNLAVDPSLPTIHPGSVREGDVVRATCHLVLHASALAAPQYGLHLEDLTVVALKPDIAWREEGQK